MKRIYLDHQATTPVDPLVLKKMLPFFTEVFGNASSNDHEFGHEAKQAVDKAREQVANAIKAFPDEIIFTSGATEANNLALLGVAKKMQERGRHIITSVTEHKAILDTTRYLETIGFEITYLPVDRHGCVDLDHLTNAIRKDTILVSIMAANNEIGTVAPLADIGRITREKGVYFHTDATQALGNISIDAHNMKIDLMSLSGHKIYGPKGIGVLYRKRSNPRVFLEPILYGGGHEKGLRSGTINVPGAVGMGEAAHLAASGIKNSTARYHKLSQLFLEVLTSNVPGIELNGHPTNRIPNNINLYIPGLESRALIVKLKTVAISTGSACTSTTVEPSHVITSLGFGKDRAHSSIRIGIGRYNTEEDIKTAASHISESILSLKTLRNGIQIF